MEQQVSQQVEQQLRQQWESLYPQILDRFTTVSKADIEAARSTDDLVRRIADKSQFSERYVETQVHELVLIGASTQTGQAALQYSQQARTQRPFSQSGTSQGQPFQQNQ